MDTPARWSMSTATESADSTAPDPAPLALVPIHHPSRHPSDPPQLRRDAPTACPAPRAVRPAPLANARVRRPRATLPRSYSYAAARAEDSAPGALRVRGFASMRLDAALRADRAPGLLDASGALRVDVGRAAIERARGPAPGLYDELWSDVSDDPLGSARRPTLAERARTVSRSVKRIVGRVTFSRNRRRFDRHAFR